ncbi:KaiC domain-containing protein [Natronomonas sp. LN261]|uniref:KaiC domain-containing protein n=1 Tax=Natronomonas sp. LN261 TaxID=2750669 RepID=UPI0015EEBB86|nr:KaiC domain-containing protein [Natronomonas sp. LN261]
MSDDDWFERDRAPVDDDSDDDSEGDEPTTDDFEAAFGSESEDDEPTADDFEAAFGSESEDDEPTADDFEAAFGSGPEGGDDEFEEELDSQIPRIELGVQGLDQMIQGGVPERSLMVAMGSAGTGKTTFGLQFLDHGLAEGEKGVYITLEESAQAVERAAEEKDWSFREYLDEDRLAIVDLDPIEMANSLTSIRGDLPRLISEFGADRLVLDSVSLLEMMYDSQAKRRTEIFDFTKSLKRAGVTTMLTSEASDQDPYTSKHGIIEYLTDAVFVLQYVRSEFGETRLAVEIQKIRNANHSRETKPYEITDEGISVYRQADIF